MKKNSEHHFAFMRSSHMFCPIFTFFTLNETLNILLCVMELNIIFMCKYI